MSQDHLDTLRRAFNLVKSNIHWQEPIDTKISLNQMSRERISISNIKEAVEFYTASVPVVDIDSKTVIIKAKGYRLTNK